MCWRWRESACCWLAACRTSRSSRLLARRAGRVLPAWLRPQLRRRAGGRRGAAGRMDRGCRRPLRRQAEHGVSRRCGQARTLNLTDRELQVCQLVCEGYRDAEIADELVIELRTVHTHVRSVFGKLDMTREQLTDRRRAFRRRHARRRGCFRSLSPNRASAGPQWPCERSDRLAHLRSTQLLRRRAAKDTHCVPTTRGLRSLTVPSQRRRWPSVERTVRQGSTSTHTRARRGACGRIRRPIRR